jgi:hypothetical protein
MLSEGDVIKLLFGFKLKYLRQQNGLGLEELAEKSGLSKSYIHDLERGRKYPKVEKINTLANALGVEYDYLVSRKSSKKMQPVVDLLTSDLLKEFPLDEFGISTSKLVELLANTPERVNAFISTIMNITRHYQVEREHLYFTALRSYQNLHDNYFPELEYQAQQCRKEYGFDESKLASLEQLETLVFNSFDIKIDRQRMVEEIAQNPCRSYFSEANRTLFLRKGLTDEQERFLICRELAFQYLQLSPRPLETRILDVQNFEILLNNFKASYFASAFIMNESQMIEDIEAFANQTTWNPASLGQFLPAYGITPEMLMQRLTNLLPHHFELSDLFFIRLQSDERLEEYRMTKELHLARLHSPYANALDEHYCRRWVSVNILQEAQGQASQPGQPAVLIDAQLSEYWQTDSAYLCLSMSRPAPDVYGKYSSVTLGLQINEELRARFRFLSDPRLPVRTVNTTCERCSIPDCSDRAQPAVELEVKSETRHFKEQLKKLDSLPDTP